ncbi:anti-sigma factor antagonist [Leptospira sp. GIMC2001]|uniref:anti-sigma factor antagonist n=1 Tax=Leptospira sp. GIMC2001 TaxID=1513297 RepID=UPI00234ACE9D|nr:anti-sigma factor antagonist [Leptospira sp. GIMC2001]WCL49561.1 anti-sigma factor antagonist [Leptospira sp. GIMC2001]
MQVEVKLEYPIVAAGTPTENHLLVRLKTPPVVKGQRQPLVVGLAIDKSWSMKGEKMDAVLEAASALVNWLTRLDYLAVIAYSNDVQVVQALTNLTEKISITDKIRNIKVATSTNLSGGWLQTLRALDSKKIEGAFKRVILLTDGNPTLGIKEPSQFIQIAKDHAAKGISTTTIGVGDDFNEDMLREIASAGGGNFHFIDNPEQASDIFFQEFGDIGALYAQAIELKVEIPSSMQFESVLNNLSYDKSEDISEFRGDMGAVGKQTIQIQAGDIRSDDIKNIILKFKTSNSKVKGINDFKIEASYYNLLEGMKLETVSANGKFEYGNQTSKQDPDVLVELLVVQTADAILTASELIRNGNSQDARSLVSEQIGRLEKSKHYAPNALGSLLNRLQVLESKINENSNTVSKIFLASGSNLSSKGADMMDMKDVNFHDDIFIYSSIGDIDLYKCPEIKTLIQEKMTAGFRFIIFDMKGTSHIDSSAIGTLIQIVGWLRRRGGELIVSDLKDSVRKVFEITKLYNHIRVAQSLDDAKESISRILITREGDKN